MADLTDAQLSRMGDRLLALRQEIAASLETGGDAAKPVELDQPIGRLSRMDAIQQQQMARATRSAQQVRQQQISAALAALKSGTYGDCRRCEEPIGIARLEARPESAVCVDCQAELEKV